MVKIVSARLDSEYLVLSNVSPYVSEPPTPIQLLKIASFALLNAVLVLVL